MPPEALEGLCPRCMGRVVFGNREAGGEQAEGQGQKAEDAAAGGPVAATIKVEPETDMMVEATGMRIGRYKLLEKIGEGGFGWSIWPSRSSPSSARWPSRSSRPGMDTREVIARFEAERQALALMDHPNIARVLDAGATEAGRPYFVMELVQGHSDHRLLRPVSALPDERLALFITVCQAVQHAHQKGVIHRDIKPSNVLVTLHDGKPVPKVIDFGIAKALGRS